MDWYSAALPFVNTGLALLVATIYGWQLWTMRRTLQEALKSNRKLQAATAHSWSLYATDLEQQVHRVIIESPHLYPFIYSGKQLPLRKNLRNQVLATAQMYIDLFDCMIYQADKAYDYSPEDWQGWFDWHFEHSPALRYLWVRRRQPFSYSRKTVEILDRALHKARSR